MVGEIKKKRVLKGKIWKLRWRIHTDFKKSRSIDATF